MFSFREVIMNWLKDRANMVVSMTKLFGLVGMGSMTYNFIHGASVDFQGYGLAVGGMMSALALKYHVEGIKNDTTN